MTTPEAREAGPLPQPEERPQSPADILTREISHKTAYDFVNSCAVFASIIDARHPNLVFIPQRGAGPIQWVTEEFITAAGQRMPLFIDLPIGTHTIREGDKSRHSGIKGEQKRSLVQQTLNKLADDGTYMPGKSRIMLMDEVQKGGTITQVAQALYDAILDVRERQGISEWNEDRDNLFVLAAQDNRTAALRSAHKPSYKKLVSNEREGFTGLQIPTSMFMVDRAEFLDEITKVSNKDITTLDDVVVRRNETARRLFKTMAHVFLAPRQALEELEDLHIQKVAQDLTKTVLQIEMLEALTNPNPVRSGKGATESHTFEWWLNFCKYAVKERNGNGHNDPATKKPEAET